MQRVGLLCGWIEWGSKLGYHMRVCSLPGLCKQLAVCVCVAWLEHSSLGSTTPKRAFVCPILPTASTFQGVYVKVTEQKSIWKEKVFSLWAGWKRFKSLREHSAVSLHLAAARCNYNTLLTMFIFHVLFSPRPKIIFNVHIPFRICCFCEVQVISSQCCHFQINYIPF